jgi:hypothetical protein
MRRFTIIPGLVAVALVAVALAVSAGPAGAVTQSRLENAGWTCISPQPVTDEPHCFRPGGLQGLFSGEARAVTALVFDLDGRYLGTEINVRGDVFHGQPCRKDPPTYEYTHLLPIFGIDYWACHRFDSSHL